MKKNSNLQELMGYAGGHRYLTYLSLLLSAISAILALFPFVFLFRIIQEVIAVAPNYAQATHIVRNGWMAAGFAVLSILPDSLAVIIDEAHKLPETARQMFGVTLRAEDIQGLIHDLRREKYLLAADALADTSRLFLRKLERPHNPDKRFSEYARLLVAPNRALTVVRKQVNPIWTGPASLGFRGNWSRTTFPPPPG